MLSKTLAILRVLRFKDVVIFSIPVLVGLVISISDVTLISAGKGLVSLFASSLLMMQIFCFNDWSDSILDSKVIEKSNEIHNKHGISRDDLLVLSIVLSVVCLGVFILISNSLFIIALSILMFGIVYSYPHPRFKGKATPIFSSILHITGAMLAFLLGYNTFSEVDARGILIGGYFAFLLTAGHFIQEVQDHAGDHSTNISTNAVHFGQNVIYFCGFALFVCSFAYLYSLAHFGLIPPALKYIMVFLPIFVFMGISSFRAGLNYSAMQNFRGQYRILFGVVVFIIIWVMLLNR